MGWGGGWGSGGGVGWVGAGGGGWVGGLDVCALMFNPEFSGNKQIVCLIEGFTFWKNRRPEENGGGLRQCDLTHEGFFLKGAQLG